MRVARYFMIVCASCLLLAATAGAGEVRVFKPKEEDVSPMQLRKQAMAEGFAQAVLEEAGLMLPKPLDEVRKELLRVYFVAHAKPYVLGYKILSSQDMAAGLILSMDVRGNKKTLRQGLRRMGLLSTAMTPVDAAVSWPEGLDEESMVQLQGLVTLTGIRVSDGVLPSFALEEGPEKTWKARLTLGDREWVAANKDMAAVWFDLWAHYFTRSGNDAFKTSSTALSITGWFSPDGVLEFDRVLRTWDSAVQEVKLVEMDMQPAGVGARWDIRILKRDRLDMMLRAYLPQRGLSYQLSEDADK